MESEDKRLIRGIYGRVFAALLVLAACRSQADPPALDAAPPTAPIVASVSAPLPLPPPVPPPEKPAIYGEWERQSEPYKGMRIALREREGRVLVTRPSTVEEGAKNKAQLECQRSLWKVGDVLVTDFNGAKGTIVLRDWGLTQGVCRHQDTKAPASFIRAEEDILAIAVTRGKTMVTQEWTRVR